MKRYFGLQLKRLMKNFPFALTVVIVLFISLVIIFSSFVNMNEASDENQTFKIGISGDTDNQFFQIGKSALETFDSSRFSISFVELSELEAEKQLQKGEISAYAVMPEGFIEDALAGKVGKIKYVTSTGSVGLVSIFKNEITKVVQEILTCSQKGVFGLEEALVDNGQDDLVRKHINKINIEYIELIVSRGEMYTVEELGISDGLSLPQYLLCGITVLYVFIIGLPYVGGIVKKDLSLQKVISAKGYGFFKQLTSETCAYMVVLLCSVVAILSAVAIICVTYPSVLKNETLEILDLLKFAIQILPVVFLAASFCIMIFEFTDNIVSAVLLQFFLAVSLCYITGCLYPIYTFPVAVQKMAPFLPMGSARVYLQNCVAGEFSFASMIRVVLFAVLFFVVTLLVRKYKINKRS